MRATEKSVFSDQLNINDFEKRSLSLFWIGFIIYTSVFALYSTERVNYIVCNVLQILGIIIMVPSSVFLINLRIENKYLRVTFLIYCLWLFGVVLRGFLFEYGFIKIMLLNAYEGIFIYFSPIILLFHKNLYYVRRIFNVIIILGIVYIVFDIVFIKQLLISYDDKNSQAMMEYFSKTLSIPCGFILLTYIYHSDKRNILALFVLLITFILSIVRARRALAFLVFCPLVFSYIIYFIYSKSRIFKFVFFIMLSIMLLLGIVYMNSIIGYFSSSSTTGWFVDRISHNTRAEVEQYFYQDMKPLDWAIGKGIDGKYFCPGVEEGVGRLTVFRKGIETDYLTIILKGGIISLGLMLIIAIPAIINGLFYSKNLLSKASAIWILLYLISLYPAPVTAFTMNYLLVWISIGICYTKELRDIPDSIIKEALSGRTNNT